MNAQKRKAVSQERRRNRVRRVVRGTADRPRLTVFRSSKHIYVQLIDDDQGKTLVAASTVSPELKGKVNYGGNIKAAEAVGDLVAQKAKSAGLSKICFDRGHYRYHGRIKALADAARKGGLDF
ncbi:MAG: 50S ribosomal protein L18 [Gemmataceae bacterium]|nr:50S ribosomal protein L18 [Gemmataceae bacterium]